MWDFGKTCALPLKQNTHLSLQKLHNTDKNFGIFEN